MSESPKRSLTRQEAEELEVRQALLGDAGERNSAWLFEQLGDTIGTPLRDRDAIA